MSELWSAVIDRAFGAKSSETNELRSLGDKARDASNWDLAIEKYRGYLNLVPQDFAIWVQLGHALKEVSAFTESAAAYEEAIKLNPKDYDVHLNKGHLLKLAGDVAGAILSYKAAYRLNTANEEALKELVSLSADLSDLETKSSLQETKTIFIDMTDLIEYSKTNPSLSGIQRVVANLIGGIEAFAAENKNVNIVPVIPEYDKMRIFTVNRNLVLTMISSLQKSGGERENLDKAIRAVYASRKLVMPKTGDIFVVAGAFWIYPHYDMIQNLRAQGVKFVVFVHDLIQISHPEYVHEAATLIFRRALVDVLMLANGILTNSEFVAEDVRKFMRSRMNFDLPVKAVLLSTELNPPSEANMFVSAKVRDAMSEPYVLSVSTIEIRKNHMYMIQIWEKLIKEGAAANIPNLVFAGKLGWAIEEFQEYLDSSDHLGGRLRIVTGASDYELGELYKNSLFTIFPSFVEGFGLPVGESLAYGKPCFCSDRASMPEVGGQFVRYFDPENVSEGYSKIREILNAPDALAAWAKQISTSYKPKSWGSFAREFYETVSDLSNGAEASTNCRIEAADIVGMGRAEIAWRDSLKQPLVYLSAARQTGWHCVEDWGCWMNARRAILSFSTRLPPNTDVLVYLALQVPLETNSSLVTVTVVVGGVTTLLRGLNTSSSWFVVPGVTGEEGRLTLSFFSAGHFSRPDTGELYTGLRALAYSKKDDVMSRVDVLERITFEKQTNS